MVDEDREQDSSAIREDVSEMRGEIREIKRNLGKISGNERLAVWFVGVLSTLLPILYVSFSIYNSKQFEAAIERAERRIAELSGTLRPEEAVIQPRQFEEKNTVTMEATITPEQVGFIRYFHVQLEGTLLVSVKGGSGRITGYSSVTSGDLAEFSSLKFDGSVSRIALNEEMDGQRSYETREQGLAVSEEAPAIVTFLRRNDFPTCEAAEHKIKELVDRKGGVGKIGLIAYFSDIEKPMQNHVEFNAKVVRGDYPSCQQMRSMRKWMFEASDTSDD